MQMITPDEARHIERIVERAQAHHQHVHKTVSIAGATPLSIMDYRAQLVAIIAGCHLNAVRMNLRAWAEAPQLQFLHDLQLIRYQYNPTTERLESPKRPLFAAPPRRKTDDPEADLMADNFDNFTHPGLADLAGGNDDDDGEDDQ